MKKEKWYEQHKNDLWFTILFGEDRLNWKENFLEEKRGREKTYGEYVNESILSAAKSMKSISPGELIAISQLLHTASSVVLLESHRSNVDATLKFFQGAKPFRNIDPSIVLTSTALYFLICYAEDRHKDDYENRKMIEHVHARLDEVNWYLRREAVNRLGIKPLQSSQVQKEC